MLQGEGEGWLGVLNSRHGGRWMVRNISARVVEAGTGSARLTAALAYHVMPEGRIYTYEVSRKGHHSHAWFLSVAVLWCGLVLCCRACLYSRSE